MQEVEVLGNPAVAGLGEAKVAFHDQERMLHLRPDPRLAGLLSPISGMHSLQHALTGSNLPLHILQVLIACDLGALMCPLIPRITVNNMVIGTQEFMGLIQIMHIRRCPRDRVDIPSTSIHSGMSLHSEVPLVALLRLMHLRIPLTCRVLR